MKILIAVDGSKPSLDAVSLVIKQAGEYREAPQVELVAVHRPVPKVGVARAQVQKYYEEEGEQMLAAAKKKLDAAGVKYQAQILIGDVAESIVKHAKSARCDLICIGDRGMSDIGNLLLGSTATKVLHLSDVPVLLVK